MPQEKKEILGEETRREERAGGREYRRGKKNWLASDGKKKGKQENVEICETRSVGWKSKGKERVRNLEEEGI